MAQLVQLQKDLEKIEATGTHVVAISYDAVDILQEFASKKKIAFPLLSDSDSKIITAYGILNKDAKGKASGVPNPETFLVDKLGIVRAKLFREGPIARHTNAELIAEAEKLK